MRLPSLLLPSLKHSVSFTGVSFSLPEMRAHPLPFLLFLYAILLFCTGCGGKEPPAAPPETFRYAELSTVRSLDPLQAESRGERWLAGQLFNTLFEVGEDLNLYPVLVRDYRWSADRKVCRLLLRERVFFHRPENRQLTARDVAFSLRRALRERPELPICQWLKPENVRVTDLLKLELLFEEPFEEALWWLTDPRLSIVLPEAIQQNAGNFAESPVGTGPFALEHWYPRNSVKLVRHPQYFKTNFRGHPLPLLKGVYVSFPGSQEQAVTDFREGNLDLCYPVQRDSSLRNYQFSRTLLEGYFLELDSSIAPELRRKIVRSLRREELAGTLKKTVLKNYWPDFIPAYTQWQHYPTPYLRSAFPDSLRLGLYAEAGTKALGRELEKESFFIPSDTVSQVHLRFRQVPYPSPLLWMLPYLQNDSLPLWRMEDKSALEQRLRSYAYRLRQRYMQIPLLLEVQNGLLNPEVQELHLDATGMLRLEQVSIERKPAY